LWNEKECVGIYDIGLGFSPIGHKKREGDGKTPEGSYVICSRNRNSKFYLSFGLSYPNTEDAEEGYHNYIINKEQLDEIANAIRDGFCPPWNTPLGGAVMIHGHGSDTDWTAGCIAVNNDIMDILWEYCTVSTPVTIYE
jgi:murein L,D-transpeptidase YafK